MKTSSKALAGRLQALAESQGGFFTAGQASAMGYADSIHGYHVRNGDWEKVRRGIYRLRAVAPAGWADLYVLGLWSVGRGEGAGGVFWRETALQIHGVVPREGEKMHMAVPVWFRRSAEIPEQLELAKLDIPAGDTEDRAGYRVTTLKRTLSDVLRLCTDQRVLAAARRAAGSGADGETARSPQIPVASPARPPIMSYAGWDEEWSGETTFSAAGWSGGKSFEDAINAGED